MESTGRPVHHGGTVRAALLPRTKPPGSRTHGHTRSASAQNLLLLLAGSAALGLGLAIVWSPTFVDQTIGENGATTILGYSVTATPLTGALMAIGFAFVSGLTGTFTACNVAGLSAIGALIGPSIPQLSHALIGRFPIRLIQSMVVFGILGLVLFVMGLAAMGVIRVPARRPAGRYATARLVLIGGLIGAFLIGRPFVLFVKIFEYAAATHNPALGALVFVLQSLGNIAVLALIFLVVAAVGRGRLLRWLASRPDRLARFNAIALLAAGTFLIAYWCVRLPAVFGIGWWPRVPWS